MFTTPLHVVGSFIFLGSESRRPLDLPNCIAAVQRTEWCCRPASSYDSGVLLWLLMTLLCSMLWFLCATNIVLSPTTKPMHGSPARALVNRCDQLRLENLHVGSPHGFKPAADEPLAAGRNLSIPARSSVSSSRPLSVQLCRCTTAVILGAPWGKNATPL